MKTRLILLSLAMLNPFGLFDYLASFKYEVRGGCVAYSLERFIAEKGGSCKDFAYFTGKVLKVIGYDPKILVIKIGEDTYHAVTVFQYDGKHSGIYKFDGRALYGPYKNYDLIVKNRPYREIGIRRDMCQ